MHKSFVYRRHFYLFTLFALFGLLSGFLFAAGTDPYLLSLMRRAAVSRVSIILLLPACALPLLIAAYAVSIKNWSILYTVCFYRFLCWAYCAFGCIYCFGTACWLVQPLMQYSDNLTLVIFCLLCRHGTDIDRGLKREVSFALIGTVLTVIADYILVSPYLAALF